MIAQLLISLQNIPLFTLFRVLVIFFYLLFPAIPYQHFRFNLYDFIYDE